MTAQTKNNTTTSRQKKTTSKQATHMGLMQSTDAYYQCNLQKIRNLCSTMGITVWPNDVECPLLNDTMLFSRDMTIRHIRNLLHFDEECVAERCCTLYIEYILSQEPITPAGEITEYWHEVLQWAFDADVFRKNS